MKERSWNLINEENFFVFFRSRRPCEAKGWVACLSGSRIGPGAVHIRVCCRLWPMGMYLWSTTIQLFPGQPPSKAEDGSQGWTFGSRGGIAGDRDDGWVTVHISRADLIRASESLLFLVSTIYPCVFEHWLTHSVIPHHHLEVPSDDIFQCIKLNNPLIISLHFRFRETHLSFLEVGPMHVACSNGKRHSLESTHQTSIKILVLLLISQLCDHKTICLTLTLSFLICKMQDAS